MDLYGRPQLPIPPKPKQYDMADDDGIPWYAPTYSQPYTLPPPGEWEKEGPEEFTPQNPNREFNYHPEKSETLGANPWQLPFATQEDYERHINPDWITGPPPKPAKTFDEGAMSPDPDNHDPVVNSWQQAEEDKRRPSGSAILPDAGGGALVYSGEESGKTYGPFDSIGDARAHILTWGWDKDATLERVQGIYEEDEAKGGPPAYRRMDEVMEKSKMIEENLRLSHRLNRDRKKPKFEPDLLKRLKNKKKAK